MTVAVATALVGAVALTAVYLFLYLQDRERFLGLWTIAWAFNAVRYLAELTAVAWSDSGVWEPVSHTAGLIVAGLLVAGARILAEGGGSRSWILVLAVAAGALWAWGAWLAGASFLVASMPVRVLMGVGFLWAGYIVWRARTLRGVGRPVVAVTFLLWGIHKLDYPFLRPLGWFAPWGFGLSAVFEIVLAFGTMVVYFEKVRSQVEARFSALFEENLCVMALVDQESGLIVDANPAACAFYGYGRDQFRGMHVRALNEHPDAEWRPLVIPDARASRASFRF
ncbi:MAG: PAS domain S-box protein, partial [Thermoleophilia bacterium]